MTDSATAPEALTLAPEDLGPWGLLVGLGVLSIIASIVALVWPGPTLLLMGLTFGVYLVFAGVGDLVAAVAGSSASGGIRALKGILGLITLAAGVILIIHPAHSVLTIAWVLGLWFVLAGAMQLARGVAVADKRVFNILFGLIGLVAGLIVLIHPGVGLKTLVLIVSISFMARGLVAIAAGLAVRRLSQA